MNKREAVVFLSFSDCLEFFAIIIHHLIFLLSLSLKIQQWAIFFECCQHLIKIKEKYKHNLITSFNRWSIAVLKSVPTKIVYISLASLYLLSLGPKILFFDWTGIIFISMYELMCARLCVSVCQCVCVCVCL